MTTDNQTVTVTATNNYRDLHGKLAITKAVTGETAPDVDFTFDVTGPDENTFTVDITAGDTWTSDWLPLGTYTITERDAPANHTITPNPVTLTTDNQTVTVTATNNYRDLHGKLAITKVETGETGPRRHVTIDVAGPTRRPSPPHHRRQHLDLGLAPTRHLHHHRTRRTAPGHMITPNPSLRPTKPSPSPPTTTRPPQTPSHRAATAPPLPPPPPPVPCWSTA